MTLALAGILLGAGALGRVLLGSAAVAGAWRRTVAEQLLGVLVYLALFGALVQIDVRLPIAVAFCVALAVLATLTLAREGLADPARLARRAALGVAAGGVLLALGGLRPNPIGWDPLAYALSAATTFRTDWLRANAAVVPLPMRDYLLVLERTTEVSRSSSVALLWPPAALGVPVDESVVTRLSVALLIPAALLVADLLRGLSPAWVRIVVAVGSVGVFSLRSAAVGGQIAQAVGLVSVLAMVWLVRFVDSDRVRLLALALAGNVVAAGYPEFLLAVPAYFACAVMVGGVAWRGALAGAAAIVAGAALVQVTTRLESLRFLTDQAGRGPGWAPFDAPPHGIAGLWTLIVWQEATWGVALLVLGLVVLARPRASASPPDPLRLPAAAVVAGLALMVPLWSWAALRSANVGYGAFKLGGWLGPALVLLAWAAVVRLPPKASRVALALLVALMSARAADMVVKLPGLLPQGADAWRPRLWTREPRDTTVPCTVQTVSDNVMVIFGAIAESAAPVRGCAVRSGPRPDLAAAYRVPAPGIVRSGSAVDYSVWILNASAHEWAAAGPDAVRLGVRTTKDGAPGDWRWFPLPHAVGPLRRVSVGVRVETPAGGEYRLEHRLARGDAWSAQALDRSVRLD